MAAWFDSLMEERGYMDKVRIGFVGVGGMGQCAHLRNYVTLPECEVVAIAEVRENLGRSVAERYGVGTVYANHLDMIAAEKLDGIVASQPFNRHGVLIPDLCKAGVPILTEKPLSSTVESGEAILKAEQESGVWHMVGYHKRSDPATMRAKDEIERLKSTGELGKLRYVRILMPAGDWVANGFADLLGSDEPFPAMEFEPPPLDMDSETYDHYMAFVNYYIHQVNLMRHLLGESYEVTYADPSQVVLAVRSKSGVAGVIEMTPYRTTVDWQESALVCFEMGWVKIELPAPLASNRPGRVEIYRDPGGREPELIVPTLPWVHAMRQQAANFVAAIKGEREPMCNASDALADLIVARDYIRLLRGV